MKKDKMQILLESPYLNRPLDIIHNYVITRKEGADGRDTIKVNEYISVKTEYVHHYHRTFSDKFFYEVLTVHGRNLYPYILNHSISDANLKLDIETLMKVTKLGRNSLLAGIKELVDNDILTKQEKTRSNYWINLGLMSKEPLHKLLDKHNRKMLNVVHVRIINESGVFVDYMKFRELSAAKYGTNESVPIDFELGFDDVKTKKK